MLCTESARHARLARLHRLGKLHRDALAAFHEPLKPLLLACGRTSEKVPRNSPTARLTATKDATWSSTTT